MSAKAKGCDRCGSRAVTYVRYSGAHLCARHLTESVITRAQASIRKQMDVDEAGPGVAVIVVAASGGKDSGTCLDILARTFAGRRDVEIVAVTIDEGTAYRKGCIGTVAGMCGRLGVRHEVRSFEDAFGVTMDRAITAIEAKGGKTPCSYCGVLRRTLLNRTAREFGAFRIATGLNLDDTAQTVLMNLTRGDLVRMARMAPHTRVQPGLVPRVQPLISIPEKETYLYAKANGIPVHEGTCPYRGAAMRNRYRRMVFELEMESPGTRHALLNSFLELKEMLLDRHAPAELPPCGRCGEPTMGTVCEACAMLDDLNA